MPSSRCALFPLVSALAACGSPHPAGPTTDPAGQPPDPDALVDMIRSARLPGTTSCYISPPQTLGEYFTEYIRVMEEDTPVKITAGCKPMDAESYQRHWRCHVHVDWAGPRPEGQECCNLEVGFLLDPGRRIVPATVTCLSEGNE